MAGLNMEPATTLGVGSGTASWIVSRAVSLYLGRSSKPSVIESRSNAPICCWVARMVLRIFPASHRPANTNANCAERLPNSYQLFCIQFMISFMAAPLVWLHLHWVSVNIPLRHARENWHKVQESDSFVPAPAFHANFSHRSPSTPPPPGRLLTALSSAPSGFPKAWTKTN